MPVKRFTDRWIANVKPPTKDGQRQVSYISTSEQRGLALVLVVSYGGTKTFRVMTYEKNGNGKTVPRTRKLGTYPQMKLKDAWGKAREYWEDPQKFAAEEARAGSFKEVAEDWFKEHVVTNGLRSASEIRRHLEVYIYPQWKDRPFLEIRRRAVNQLTKEIADKSGLSQADAVLATIRMIMTWYQTQDEDYTSPIVRGMKRDKRKAKDRKRKRILDDKEIRAVWKATEPEDLKKSDQPIGFGAIVRLALLTGHRRLRSREGPRQCTGRRLARSPTACSGERL